MTIWKLLLFTLLCTLSSRSNASCPNFLFWLSCDPKETHLVSTHLSTPHSSLELSSSSIFNNINARVSRYWRKNTGVCTGFATKQYQGGYHNVVSASQKSQVQNKGRSRHYMKVYTLQQEEKETERKISQLQLQSQTLWLISIRLTNDGEAK